MWWVLIHLELLKPFINTLSILRLILVFDRAIYMVHPHESSQGATFLYRKAICEHWFLREQQEPFSSHIKDTGQRVDPALYGFQHAPLGGHVLLSRHGNTVDTKREMSWEVKIYSLQVGAVISTVKCIWVWGASQMIRNSILLGERASSLKG